MNFAYQGRHALAKLVSMATSSMATVASSNQNSFWLTDPGAFDHVTPDLVQLSLHQQPTVGNESVTVGSWQELLVTHFGNGKLVTPSHNFKLNNILFVPQLASNLLFVHKLCLQNNAFCYFDAYKFSIQDLPTGKILYKGLSKDGVYPIPLLSTFPLLHQSIPLALLLCLIKHCFGIRALDVLAPRFFIQLYLILSLFMFFLIMTSIHNALLV